MNGPAGNTSPTPMAGSPLCVGRETRGSAGSLSLLREIRATHSNLRGFSTNREAEHSAEP